MNERLHGHSLLNEGAPFASRRPNAPGAQRVGKRWFERLHRRGTGGEGVGVCSCGESSFVLRSGAARQHWHRGHKDTMARKVTK